MLCIASPYVWLESSNWAINAEEATKNICCAKVENTVDYSTVTKWFKKFCLGCKNLDNQARSGRPKNINSKVMLQAIKVNKVNNTQRVSGRPSISQSNYLHNPRKRYTKLCLRLLKYYKTFNSTCIRFFG